MIYRNYSTTILISPVYSIGFCASIIIIIQIISGYILASNYIAETNETFNIVNNIIMRELDTGWLIRYNHINGCGILFIVIYMHMYRTIYYNSISKTTVWIIGVVMYIILCGIAFTGYSLVYGQMSLWAIVVICSLVTAIPIVGSKILILIWGGSVVSSVTLQRIFCVHYILPLIIILLIILHLYNLHAINSTGDMYSISNRYDRISFYPLLLIRDIYIGSLLLIVLNVCVYYYSDIFVHSDNYIPANPLVTPSEIMPEFYLLPFYALVRAIPNKVLGIVIMILFILSLSNIGRSYYNNSMIIHRSLLIIMVIDIYLSSNLCLLINHNESFYILIIMSVIGVMSNGINSSINSNSNNTILNIVIVLIIDILINIRSIVLIINNISNNMIGLNIVLVLIIHIYNYSMNRYSNRNNNNEIVISFIGFSTTLLVIQDNNKIINSVIVLYNNNSIISSYTISKYNI